MSTSGRKSSQDRWISSDNRLIVCRSCREPIVKNVPQHRWSKILPEELHQFREVIGEEMPCDLCQMTAEAKAFAEGS